MSPIKLKSVPKHQRLPTSKIKFDQITKAATIIPESWSPPKSAEFLNVSIYLI